MMAIYKTNIAYCCSFCSEYNLENVNVFDISPTSVVELVCHNECSDYSVILKKRSKKYIVEAECVVCGRLHTYTMDGAKFWSKRLKILRCPSSDVEIVFIGSVEDIDFAIKRQENDIKESIAGNEYNSNNMQEIILGIAERIQQLLQNNAVVCNCKENKITIKVEQDHILIKCDGCGKTKKIPYSKAGLAELLNNTKIKL